MQINRNGSQPSSRGPAEYFTGSVRIHPLFTAPGPGLVACASVIFESDARSAWHAHSTRPDPARHRRLRMDAVRGRPIEEIRADDVIWCPPGHRHWHGATPTTSMTPIAIQDALDGRVVDWMEHVTDEQYLAGPKGKS